MATIRVLLALAVCLAPTLLHAAEPVPVDVLNYVRAESDMQFKAYAAKAESLGVMVLNGAEVVGIECTSYGFSVRAGSRSHECGALVNAAGAWAADIGTMLDDAIAVTPAAPTSSLVMSHEPSSARARFAIAKASWLMSESPSVDVTSRVIRSIAEVHHPIDGLQAELCHLFRYGDHVLVEPQ